MIDEKAFAERELKRHRDGMLYAERQLVKGGEFEAAAESLLRRSRRRQVATAVFAVAMLAGMLPQPRPWMLVWLGVMLVYAAVDHAQIRRTLETIRSSKASRSAGPR